MKKMYNTISDFIEEVVLWDYDNDHKFKKVKHNDNFKKVKSDNFTRVKQDNFKKVKHDNIDSNYNKSVLKILDYIETINSEIDDMSISEDNKALAKHSLIGTTLYLYK